MILKNSLQRCSLAEAGYFLTAGLQRMNDTVHCVRNHCKSYMLCSLLGKEKWGGVEICFTEKAEEDLLYKMYVITSHVGA